MECDSKARITSGANGCLGVANYAGIGDEQGIWCGAANPLWVSFEFDSDALSAPGKKQARALGEALADSAFRDSKFSIVGHTDRHGSDAYNINLSLRRAESVKRFLLTHFQIAKI